MRCLASIFPKRCALVCARRETTRVMLASTLAHEVITTARSRGLIQGCYLMPSFGRYDLVGELAQELLRQEPATFD